MKKLFTLFVAVLFTSTMMATTWTVAGSPTTLFGSSWSATDTANDMTDQGNGIFLWSKENVSLSAGTVEFKVCMDHGWNTSYGKDGGSSNCELTISEDGIYDIAITFNSGTHVPSASATLKQAQTVLPTVMMHGTFTGDWDDTDAFTVAQGDESCSLTLTLAVGTHEFGMKFDGAWKANGAALTRTNTTTSLSSGSGNMTINADVAGDYTFTYTYETQQLSVTYPEYVEVTHTYTVAASFAGSNWAPDNTAFDMTANEQVYTLTLNNVELHKGTWYGYKVCVDHAWDGAYGKNGADNGDNAELPEIEANGLYTVTFTLDLSAESPIPSADITKTDDIDASQVFIAAGCLYENETENDAEGFVGAKWDKDNTANQLSEVEEGVWAKTYTSVPAGTYWLKVVSGYDWSTAYPGNNIEFTLTEATDVAVYFYEDGNYATLKIGDEWFGVWTVAGTAVNGDVEWDFASEANKMTSEDGRIWTLAVNSKYLEVGTTYAWKVGKDNADVETYGKWVDGEGWVNQTFSVEKSGYYNIVYNFDAAHGGCWENKTEVASAVEIAVPEAISGTKYLTFGNVTYPVSFAAFDDITLYTAKYDNEKRVIKLATVAVKEVPANTGVILFKEAGFTEALTLPVLGEAADLGDNDLKVSDGSVQGAEDIFCLSDGENGLGFYPVDASIQVPVNKAYLKLNLGTQPAPRYVWLNGDTTGIDALENGEATAEKAGAIYTLDGRRVNGNLSQGLYIQNGKKFVVK